MRTAPKVVDRLTLKEYRRQDIPVKCRRCRRWMRHEPEKSYRGDGTARTYVKRSPAPNAARCADCTSKGTP